MQSAAWTTNTGWSEQSPKTIEHITLSWFSYNRKMAAGTVDKNMIGRNDVSTEKAKSTLIYQHPYCFCMLCTEQTLYSYLLPIFRYKEGLETSFYTLC